jgi:hypothetical protein
VLGRIRTSINLGWPLGDEAFVEELANLGIKVSPGRAGRPKSVPDLGQARA